MTADEVCTMVEASAGERLMPEEAINVGALLLTIDAKVDWLSNNAKTLLMHDVLAACVDALAYDERQTIEHATR